MKINARAYRSFNNNEPIEIQEIDGKRIEIHYMNESPYLGQYVPRGRFYFWTSDGKGYRLIVEKGFYEHVKYFFAEDINGVWVNFLDDLGKTYGKNNKIYFIGTMGLIAILMILAAIVFKGEGLVWVFVGGMILSIVANSIYSKKMSTLVHEKNLKAQQDIREILTEEGFEKLINEQEDYMKNYFNFEEEEDEELATVEIEAENAIDLEESVIEETLEQEDLENDNDER